MDREIFLSVPAVRVARPGCTDLHIFPPVSLGQRRILSRNLLREFVFITVEICRNMDFISYIL